MPHETLLLITIVFDETAALKRRIIPKRHSKLSRIVSKWSYNSKSMLIILLKYFTFRTEDNANMNNLLKSWPKILLRTPRETDITSTTKRWPLNYKIRENKMNQNI